MLSLLKTFITQFKEHQKSLYEEKTPEPIVPQQIAVTIDLEHAKADEFEDDTLEIPLLYNGKRFNVWTFSGEPALTKDEERCIRAFNERGKYIRFFQAEYYYIDKGPVLHVPLRLPSKDELNAVQREMQILMNQITWEKTVRDKQIERLKQYA